MPRGENLVAKGQVWVDLNNGARFKVLRVYKYCARVLELPSEKHRHPFSSPYNLYLRVFDQECMLEGGK